MLLNSTSRANSFRLSLLEFFSEFFNSPFKVLQIPRIIPSSRSNRAFLISRRILTFIQYPFGGPVREALRLKGAGRTSSLAVDRSKPGASNVADVSHSNCGVYSSVIIEIWLLRGFPKLFRKGDDSRSGRYWFQGYLRRDRFPPL